MAKRKTKKTKTRRTRREGVAAAAPSAVTEAPPLAAATEQTPAAEPAAFVKSKPLANPASSSRATSAVEAARWAYVRGDVQRVAILMTVCVVIEIALWYLFKTSICNSVYSWVKV